MVSMVRLRLFPVGPLGSNPSFYPLNRPRGSKLSHLASLAPPRNNPAAVGTDRDPGGVPAAARVVGDPGGGPAAVVTNEAEGEVNISESLKL